MTARQRAAVGAPLVVALLLASFVLWSRQQPTRQGGFCANVTIEVTTLLERTERGGNEARDQAGHLTEALSRLDLLDADRLTAQAPASLHDATRTIRAELPRWQRAHDGGSTAEPPAELRSAVTELLGAYYATCI